MAKSSSREQKCRICLKAVDNVVGIIEPLSVLARGHRKPFKATVVVEGLDINHGRKRFRHIKEI
jgi:hypothetical protein